MDDKVHYEAAIAGNFTSLEELYREEPMVLHRVLTGFSESLLHITAMYDNVDFATKILDIIPETASELDSQGLSPLHLASSRKNVDMVNVLLGANPDVCTVTDPEGRTPLHLAAMKGRVEIMKVLIKRRPQAIQVLLDRSQTILHFCVKHNQLEALKLLVRHLLQDVPVVENNESVSVNSKDDDGNTILHLAAIWRQKKIIEFLLSSEVEVLEIHAVNKKGFTALGIIEQSAEDIKGKKIGKLLRETARQDTRGQVPRGEDTDPQNKYQDEEYYKDWLKINRNALMLVASLIAAMAFQAGMNPPGGVWQDDSVVNLRDKTLTYLYYLRKLPPTVSFHNSKDNGSSVGRAGADFVKDLLRTSSNYYQGPAAVWKDIWDSENIEFNHTGFFPSLIRYAGTAVLAYKSHRTYLTYITCNVVGFFSSLSVIFLLVSGLLPPTRRYAVWILRVIMWVAVTSMALCYLVALSSMVPPFYSDNLLEYSIFLWFGYLGLVLCLHIIRFISWLSNKLGDLTRSQTTGGRGHGDLELASVMVI